MLGNKIKELRVKKKLTLEELAKQVNSTKSYIWEIENKPNLKPSAELIHKLATTLDVTMEQLMDRHPGNAKDQVFFREYKKLKPETKKQLKKIMDAIKNNDD